jgi:hypothetical protein
MLVELSVVERRYHAVMEVVSGGIPVVEVSERFGVSRDSTRLDGTGARIWAGQAVLAHNLVKIAALAS